MPDQQVQVCDRPSSHPGTPIKTPTHSCLACGTNATTLIWKSDSVLYCPSCGQYHTLFESGLHRSPKPSNYSSCHKCNKPIDLDNDIFAPDGDQFVCYSCTQEHSDSCSKCGKPGTDYILDNDKRVCTACATRTVDYTMAGIKCTDTDLLPNAVKIPPLPAPKLSTSLPWDNSQPELPALCMQKMVGGMAHSIGTPPYHLIPAIALIELAKQYALGEEIKGKHAWNAFAENQTVLLNRDALAIRLGHVISHSLSMLQALLADQPLNIRDAAAIMWGGSFAICCVDARNNVHSAGSVVPWCACCGNKINAHKPSCLAHQNTF